MTNEWQPRKIGEMKADDTANAFNYVEVLKERIEIAEDVIKRLRIENSQLRDMLNLEQTKPKDLISK